MGPFSSGASGHVELTDRENRVGGGEGRGAMSRAASPGLPHVPAGTICRRPSRLDGTTRLLRLQEQEDASGRKLARPGPRAFMDEGRSTSSCPHSSRHPKFSRCRLEDRHQKIDCQSSRRSAPRIDQACGRHASKGPQSLCSPRKSDLLESWPHGDSGMEGCTSSRWSPLSYRPPTSGGSCSY